jgi:hypothetical protein
MVKPFPNTRSPRAWPVVAAIPMVAALASLSALLPVSAQDTGKTPPPAKAPVLTVLTVLTERDHRDLGAALTKALESEPDPARKEVRDFRALCEKIGRRRDAKDPAQALQETLSLSPDLGKALYYSYDYNSKGIQTGKIAAASVLDSKERPTDIKYAIHAPAKYKPSEGPYPLILCVPGTKDGKVMSPELYLQEQWLEPGLHDKAIFVAFDMPADTAQWTERQTAEGKPGGVDVMMRTLNDVRTRYAVDFERVYLCGREIGVATVMSLGAKYPQLFAGVIGRSGSPGKVGCENFRNLPTFFAGGDADASLFEEKIKTAGYDNCTKQDLAGDADIWAWIEAHPRISNPTKVTLVPGAPIPLRSYWLTVPPTDTQGTAAKIEAEIDRASNTITVKGTGVRSIALYLNDQLVDLSKPVKVVCNGAARESVIPRSLETTLQLMFSGLSDPGRVYTAVQDFDLPAQ